MLASSRAGPPSCNPCSVGISWRDIILVAGRLFLLYKGTWEIHHVLEGDDTSAETRPSGASFTGVVTQIMVLDVVFSLDSVIGRAWDAPAKSTASNRNTQLTCDATGMADVVAARLF